MREASRSQLDYNRILPFERTNGMVVDFTHIKQAVEKQLDHNNLNDILPFNPTAENIACWICNQVPHCFKVEVKESEGNTAIYEKD